MTNVLILGANGRIARFVVASLSKQSDISQTLLVRDASKLAEVPDNARVITADVLDTAALTDAVRGQDIVYANLTGDDIDEQAQSVVAAMDSAGVPRLIFVLALGIYGEVPGAFGEWNNRMIGTELRVFAKAAEVLEASDLDYTILRPAWLDDAEDASYEITVKGEPFKGTVVARQAVGDLIVEIIDEPTRHSRASLGVDRPHTDGDKPYFM